tara:strand:- start:1798 stop:2121 length:324 start_codon:yes stop_codon:yes gene_type:complete
MSWSMHENKYAISVESRHYQSTSHAYEYKVFEQPRCFDTPATSLFEGDTIRCDGEYKHRARRRENLTQMDYGDLPDLRRVKESLAMREELPPIRWKKVTKLRGDEQR